MDILGIDIGGSGIKGAPVNLESGSLASERFRIPTPQPATPKAVAKVVAQIAKHFNWNGPIGCTFPAVIEHGIVHTASNVDKSWIETPGEALFYEYTACPVVLINDADAAGYAEMTFGAGRQQKGTVIVLTFGTGIGSAIFINGNLVPNTELGHLEIKGTKAEWYTSDRVRKEKDLSWEKWGKRVDRYLAHVEFLFSPELIIIGGGVSKKHRKFFPYLNCKAQIVPALLRNEAGIVGAAMAAKPLLQA